MNTLCFLEAFPIDDLTAVMVVVDEFAGMVGETITQAQAYLLERKYPIGKFTMKPVEDEVVLALYRKMVGKYERKKMWNIIRPITKNGRKRAAEMEYNEAMAIVR